MPQFTHKTFGFRLKRFALAVDIIDDYILRQVWDLVLEYLTRHLRLSYWALLVEAPVNNEPGLAARECSVGPKPAFSFRTANGSYNGLAAYSFVEAKQLWVVNPDQQPLGPDSPIRDEWSHASNLPGFDRSPAEGIRTVILVPLQERGRKLGLLDLQSPDYHELTPRVARELENLADTLAILLPLCEMNQERRAHTMKAIDLHYDALKDEQWPPLAKPQIFVASSARADSAVTGEILRVLDEFKDRVRIHYWKEISENGNINLAMLKQIHASQFGICYFSEPAGGDGTSYRFHDNDNVVFEAGMLQALTSPVAGGPSGWIPVREVASPPPPFNFAQDRIVEVPRVGPDERLNTDSFRAVLRERLEAMLT